MNAIRQHLGLVLFNSVYIAAFAAYYLSIGNTEFLWYVLVMVALFALILGTLHRSKFDSVILWGLSLWGLMHMAGGGVRVGNDVLYGLQLLPIYGTEGELRILKYDQLVHAFGFGISTLVVFHLLVPNLGENVRWRTVLSIVALGGMGLGVVNEIVEFIAVLVFPHTGVGGYYNTALDLVFNTIGAIIAAFVIRLRFGKRRSSAEP